MTNGNLNKFVVVQDLPYRPEEGLGLQQGLCGRCQLPDNDYDDNCDDDDDDNDSDNDDDNDNDDVGTMCSLPTF